MANYYCDADGGSDANGGTSITSAKLTPSGMAAVMGSGDSGYFLEATNTYTWTDDLNFVNQNLYGVKADGISPALARKVVWDGSAAQRKIILGAGTTEIKNIRFQNSTTTNDEPMILWTGITSLTFQGCEVTDILMTSQAGWTQSIFADPANSTSTATFTIRNNSFWDLRATSASNQEYMTIFSCRFLTTGNLYFYHNSVFVDDPLTDYQLTSLMYFRDSASTFTIYMKNNNLFSRAATDPEIIRIAAGSPTQSNNYNNIYNMAVSGGYSAGANDLDTDPLVVDENNGIFTPRPSVSPLEGAGVTL